MTTGKEVDVSNINRQDFEMARRASPNRKSTSRGNTPPREQELESDGDVEEKTKMQSMLS